MEFAGTHITSFDVFKSIDRIWTAKSNYEFFRQTVCDVLDLDDFCFEARDESVTSDASTEEPDTQRFRLCHLKKVASRLAPLEEHSDGTMMAVGLLAKLFEEGPVFPLMCIEEIENCLHPAAIEKLVRFFQDNADEWPVLLTTHSPYVLNMVDPDDLRIMVVDEDGASHIGRPGNRKGINDLLKSSYQSFGDLLVTNFEDVLEKAH